MRTQSESICVFDAILPPGKLPMTMLHEMAGVIEEIGESVKTKEFPGGLYGVTACESLSTIGQDWKRLIAWRETSRYKPGSHQCLEELLTKYEVDEEDFRFDLYIPIVE